MKIQFIKSCIIIILSLLTFNACEARSTVILSIGPAYPSTYGPQVVWIPGHWDHGYWIPGQYVEYAGPAPGTGYIWMRGGAYHGHHWHRGHWAHGHH